MIQPLIYPYIHPTNNITIVSDEISYRYQVSAPIRALVQRWDNVIELAELKGDILKLIKAEEVDLQELLEKSIGRLNGRYDLRGLGLNNLTIPYLDFSDCDLYGANLAHTTFYQCQFDNACLSSCNLNQTMFTECSASVFYLDNVWIGKKAM